MNPIAPEPVGLAAEWEDLLARRPHFRDSLRLYGVVLDTWSRWSPAGFPVLRWDREACGECWGRGTSLILEGPPHFDPESLEPLLLPVLDELSGIGEGEAEAISRFAEAWDAGHLTPLALLPGMRNKSEGLRPDTLEISGDLLSFVTYLGLRPALQAYFADVKGHFSPDIWDAGACPFCSAPPSFGDIGEDGKRWLWCALCGGRWTIGRLRCPFCDNRDAKTLTRLAAEGPEEGYLVEACDVCRGYLKGVDRRARWNAASALIEDWGTPHLDLIARRKGYWRATPSLIQLAPLES